MIRSGEQYKESIRDGRVVYIDGERVQDVTTHPSFKPLVDIRARIYDMAHDPATRDIMTVDEGGEKFAVALKPPRTQEDWHAKRRAGDMALNVLGETRVKDLSQQYLPTKSNGKSSTWTENPDWWQPENPKEWKAALPSPQEFNGI
jgi:hypothetical protein